MNINDSDKKSNFVRPSIQSLHTLDGDILSSVKDESYASNIVKVITHNTNNKHTDDSESLRDTEQVKSKISFKFNLNSTSFYVGLSIILFGTLGAATYYTVKKSIQETLPKPETVVSSSTIPTVTGQIASSTIPTNLYITQKDIFSAEVIIPIEIEKLTKIQILDLVQSTKKNLSKNQIKNNINISLKTDIDLTEFLNKIQYSGPDTLIRSLTSNKIYNFGVYHKEKDDFETYLITKIDTFDLGFAGMLEWEKFMPVDLYKLYAYTQNTAQGTSSSSTIPVLPIKKSTGKFVDKVIKNIDVRMYIDTDKGTQIIYGFINKQYLLITSGESSFIDIVNKLTINNILR
jgi:hypothetical protein